MTASTNFKALRNVLGDRITVGLVGFFFDRPGQLELAEDLDKYDLLDLVNHEANAKVRLQKSTVLLGTLKAARLELVKKGAAAMQKQGADSVNAMNAARAVKELDETIIELQTAIDALTKGVQAASQWVDRKQMEVTINVTRDEATLTKLEINRIVADQVEFTQEMIEALPKTKVSSKIRTSVEKDAEEGGMTGAAKLEVLTRMASNQADADDGADGVKESSAYTEMLKMAGITPEEKK